MTKLFTIHEDARNIPSDEVLNDDSHYLSASVDAENQDIYFDFSSPEAMRDFALNLLHASEYESKTIEHYPLISDSKNHIVNGVRLNNESSRIFISYSDENI